MSEASLAQLLEHPDIWRGRSIARADAVSAGFAALDMRLPAGGWPGSGVVEVLARLGSGELFLLLPALAVLTNRESARWCTWIAPPLEPYAPALAARGVNLGRLLVVRTGEAAWACEQALRSGDCDVVLAWIEGSLPWRMLRRLQLAAQQGRTLAFLLRPATLSADEPAAALRLRVTPVQRGFRVDILRSRGGAGGGLVLDFEAGGAGVP